MLLIRLDASGLGHAKRLSVFASVPSGTAPRYEAAGKPCKAGKAAQRPSLARTNASSANARASRPVSQYANSVASALRGDTLAAPINNKGVFRFSGERGYAPEQAKRNRFSPLP
jgi:hypothetical protein